MLLNLFVCFDLLTKSCFTAYISGGNEQVPPIFCWRLRSLQSSWVKVGCGPLSNPHLTHGFIFFFFLNLNISTQLLSCPAHACLRCGMEGRGIAQLVERPTEKPGAVPTRVRVPGEVKDFSPRVSFQCRLLRCPYSPPCAIACINICTLVKNSTHWQPYHCFGHTKILHTLAEIGSAVRAAAVPYLGKATRISRNGQSSTKNKQTNKQQQQ